ncbi:hypothetical protein CALVIDRAFT_565954 [Calocera viscosa TUFC12733]|uniref:F-box domain-containing protein n=1 Tax=Calocera viscosa (strain TUFC12733) TaxID=1330018 RepID=A0A167JW69_CALVF|nr:hypothetical protein CALVIDRAFT_565954 [Calocera viscosa TUFC12733]
MVGSICKLPNELMSLIFDSAHDTAAFELANSGFDEVITRTTARTLICLLSTLLSVNRTWRHLARSLCTIWTVVPIVKELNSPFSLEDFVERSGSRPLTLVACMSKDELRRVFDALDPLMVLSRVHSLSIAILRWDAGYPVFLWTVDRWNFPALKHFALSGIYLYPNLEGAWNWFTGLADQVTSIELGTVYLPHHDGILPIIPTIPCSHLERLTVHYYYEDIAALLSNGVFPKLNVFQLRNVVTDKVPSRPLPALRLLIIEEGYSVCSRLALALIELAPRLDCLVFLAWTGYYHENFLSRFEVGDGHASAGPIHAPSLKRLVLRDGILRKSTLQRVSQRRQALVYPAHEWNIQLENVQLVEDGDETLMMQLAASVSLT